MRRNLGIAYLGGSRYISRMQQSPACPPDAAVFVPPQKPKRSHRAVKPQLATRAMLDGRTAAAREFNRLAFAIEQDLGGASELSVIERSLVEAFTGATVVMNSLNTRLVQGEAIDLGLHALVCGAMVRVASRLGLKRRAKPVEDLYVELERKRERGIAMSDMPPLIPLTSALTDPSISAAYLRRLFWTWKVVAKLLDGIQLTEQREIALFERCTGRAYNRLAQRAVRRLILLVGRRGGKDRFESAVGNMARGTVSELEEAHQRGRGCRCDSHRRR